MGCIPESMKPSCLFGNNKKNEQRKSQQCPDHKGEKTVRLLKNDVLTLQDYILSSPNVDRSSSLPATSNRRVYPNPASFTHMTTTDGLMLGACSDPRSDGDDEVVVKMEEGSSSTRRERRKKKVSFRMPEVADIYILSSDSITAHNSPDPQALTS